MSVYIIISYPYIFDIVIIPEFSYIQLFQGVQGVKVKVF